MPEDMIITDVQIKNQPDMKFKKRRAQYLSTISVSMSGLVIGCGIGWNSPSSVLLKTSNNFKLIYYDLIASAFMLGASVGIIISSLVINRIGRKLMIAIILLTFISGWIIITFANCNPHLYIIGRLLTGACCGIFSIISTIYSDKIVKNQNKETLGIFFHLLLVIGILLAYSTGFTRDIILISGINGIISIFGVIIMFLILETQQLQFFLDKDIDIENEMNEIKINLNIFKNKKIIINLLKNPLHKILMICYGIMIVQQLSGINGIIFNAVKIFEATGVDLDPVLQGVVLGVVQVIACWLSAKLIDKIECKVLMLLSEITMCLCLLVLSGFFAIKEIYPTMSEVIYWIPLASTCFYALGYCIGAGPVPWIYMNQIFPSKLKATAAPSAVFINWFLGFLITLSFESLINALGNAAVLFIFSFTCALSIFFVVTCMIETRVKSLSVIHKESPQQFQVQNT